MKDLSTFISESLNYDELTADYNAAEYAAGNEKKALASKYGTVNKLKDIQHAILLKMREERNTRKEFNTNDMTNFSRLDFAERDLSKYLEEEPIEFVRFIANKYLESLKKRRIEKYVGSTGTYGLSTSDKYYLKRYKTILSYLNENDKTDDEKLKAKEDKERIENLMQLVITKLNEQLVDFKKRLMEHVEKQATKRYDTAPETIEKLLNELKKYDGMDYRELMNGYNYKERESIRKRFANLKAILRMTKKEFIDKNLQAAEEQFNSDVNNLADRIHDKGLNIENIECTHVTQDPKFISMVITDGEKKLYCRSVIAAEYSDKMIAHFRFIITERK